jgi:hypothetical protein
MNKPVKIVQDETAPVEREVLAQDIVSISKSFDKLLRSGLNKRAIIVLIAYDTKLGIGQIENVLGSLESLAKNYTR